MFAFVNAACASYSRSRRRSYCGSVFNQSEPTVGQVHLQRLRLKNAIGILAERLNDALHLAWRGRFRRIRGSSRAGPEKSTDEGVARVLTRRTDAAPGLQ